MSVFSAVGHFFAKIGKFIGQALSFAIEKGLTEELVAEALIYVRQAATQFVSNAEKRAFVIQLLTARGIPEPIARIAVELAYQLFSAELAKLTTANANQPKP